MKNSYLKFITTSALVLLVLTGCEQKEESEYVKLLMRSPYGCTHVITLNKEGSGKIVSGEEENYDNDFTKLDYVIKEADIKVSGKDLDELNRIFSSLEGESLTKTSRPKDAFHYEVYVLNEKKIDAYAGKSETFNEIKEIIAKHYPFEVDYTCEAYAKN